MIHLYCRAHHGVARGLCKECSLLLAYADQRIDQCPFGIRKPVCNKCTVHCYRADMRERIREVMRYAGPRIFFRHPILAIRHQIRSMRYSGKRSK